VILALFALIVITSLTWTEPIGVFDRGAPPWLSQPRLIPAALIFWGFPWVGIVSVLLYLSGLGNIDQSVYEASEIDGCGWFRKFWNIELPLITTQVRLNLVLMVIATLKGWGQVFVLLGDTGGPEGAGMLPGLYMFRKAFTDGQAGYASAIGFLLFLLILYLTLINNKYVRVEK
jgi:raffinose/stachyose/melibiose transport system permease protein